MQQRLEGAERDTKELAQMLVDLGIETTDSSDR